MPHRGLRSTRKKFASFTFIPWTLSIMNNSRRHSPNTTHHWHTRSSTDCNEQSCYNFSDTHCQKEWLNNCGRRRTKPQNYLAWIKADYVIRRLLSTPRTPRTFIYLYLVFFVVVCLAQWGDQKRGPSHLISIAGNAVSLFYSPSFLSDGVSGDTCLVHIETHLLPHEPKK